MIDTRSVAQRLSALREKLTDEEFLANRGLSNEVGLYIFAYPPAQEMTVRAFLVRAAQEYDGVHTPCRARVFDLYDILLEICRRRRVLDRIPQMEAQRGSVFVLSQLQKLAPPEAYVRAIAEAGCAPGDVVMIGGVGRVYPYVRSHGVLNNIQHVVDGVPVVLFYPGAYTGQSLTLFGKFEEENYYRAFNLI